MDRLLWRLLFAAVSFCFSLGAINYDWVPRPLHQVNGVLRKSVVLSVKNISSWEKVARIEWNFQPQPGKGIIIAEFKDGKLERLDPEDQFGQRLELVNGMMLRIQNLEKGDTGNYKIRIRFHPAKIKVHTFHLMVYDPVPEPRILLLQKASDSSSKCNVTLQCSVSEKGGLDVSWRIGDALEPLEGGLDWYWFSSEGWSLHLSISTDSNITCLVSNPADQKSTSIDLTGTCSLQGGRERFWWLPFPFAIVFFWIWKKKHKQPSRKADSAMQSKKVSEIQYMEIRRVNRPREGDNDQVVSEQRLLRKITYGKSPGKNEIRSLGLSRL